jgi:hypothetical protein
MSTDAAIARQEVRYDRRFAVKASDGEICRSEAEYTDSQTKKQLFWGTSYRVLAGSLRKCFVAATK